MGDVQETLGFEPKECSDREDRIVPTMITHLMDQIAFIAETVSTLKSSIEESNRKQAISIEEIRADQKSLRIEMKEHIEKSVNNAVDREYTKTKLLLESYQLRQEIENLKQKDINRDHSARLIQVEAQTEENKADIATLVDAPNRKQADQMRGLKATLIVIVSGILSVGLWEGVKLAIAYFLHKPPTP